MIPKTTAPLTKLIRTLEGILVVGSNVALVAIPIVTNSLTATQAVKAGVILNSVTVVARSILKAVAALAPTPAPPAPPTLEFKALAPDDGVDAEGWPR